MYSVGSGLQQVAHAVVLQPVELARPVAEVTRRHAIDEAAVGGGVAHRGDRADPVGGSGSVRLLGVPDQAGVVVLGERGHPAVPVVRLEPVLERTPDPVGLVHEERHRAIVSGEGDAGVSCRVAAP
jgi:hypothetical protein